MESEFKAQLTEQAYIHEILAEFGTQDKGVFPKDKIDAAKKVDNYAYNPLSFEQNLKCEEENIFPTMYDYNENNPAPYNVFRTMGIDWDKYGASSSIIILDYDVIYQKFRVIKRVELPRTEYSFDNAVNTIIRLNKIYKPSFIYADAGSGEYQIERLHIYGDEHPSSGLKNKLKRWQFSQTVEIVDPITGELDKKPMKPFMINQLTLGFERDRIIMSPYDEILYTQLCDYEVVSMSKNGHPIYTSENEHYIDALGLAYLAMVLEFKELANQIKEYEVTTEMAFSSKSLGQTSINQMFNSIQQTYSSMTTAFKSVDPDERPSERQQWFKVAPSYRAYNSYSRNNGWGNRSSGSRCARSMW